MSESSDNLLDWLMRSHPTEFNLQEEIITRANAILRDMPISLLQDKESMILISVAKNQETSRIEIKMNVEGHLFLGALSKAILDSLSGHLEGLLSSGIGDDFIRERIRQVIENPEPHRKCYNCNFNNVSTAKYCQNCSRQLP